jgi:hypothetical protein
MGGNMNSKVEVKAEYVQSECKKRGVELSCEYRTEPLDFAVVSNKSGDLGSISAERQLYESRIYIPTWSNYMKQWAREEGFSDKQIDAENLMREVTLQEMVEFFVKKDIIYRDDQEG